MELYSAADKKSVLYPHADSDIFDNFLSIRITNTPTYPLLSYLILVGEGDDAVLVHGLIAKQG